jgi:hypothetical protein
MFSPLSIWFQKKQVYGFVDVAHIHVLFLVQKTAQKKQGSSFFLQHAVKQLSECPNKVFSFCATVGDELWTVKQ